MAKFVIPKSICALIVVLATSAGCAKNSGNNGDHHGGSEKISKSSWLSIPKNLLAEDGILMLELVPYATDARGGLLQKTATKIFFEDLIPYGDTYFPISKDLELGPEVEKVSIYVGDAKFLVVNEDNWELFDSRTKEAMLANFYLQYQGITAYNPKLVSSQSLADEKHRISLPMETSIFQEWVDRFNENLNGNCYYLSLSASGIDLGSERTVQTDEFERYIHTHFYEIESPKTGDIVVYKAADGYVIHAAFVVGVNTEKPQNLILLSKNGQTKGRAIFVDSRTIQYKIYREAKSVSYWRLRR
ncbi:MAG: hypothetical protein KDD35_10140 [Bdellovibrionales bacterium]|nr:hypothetical protein [Bdellovibrionales bacterium]